MRPCAGWNAGELLMSRRSWRQWQLCKELEQQCVHCEIEYQACWASEKQGQRTRLGLTHGQRGIGLAMQAPRLLLVMGLVEVLAAGALVRLVRLEAEAPGLVLAVLGRVRRVLGGRLSLRLLVLLIV